MIRLIGLSLASFAFLPALAAADERGSYVTLDRVGTDNVVGLAVSAHFMDGFLAPDLAFRENLYGRFVDSSGFGAYGQLSVSHAFGNGDSETGVGGAEIGGLYAARLAGLDLVASLGVGLPMSSSSVAGFLSNYFGTLDRIEDYGLTAPHTVWLRPGVAIRFGGPSLFAQLGGGIDVPIGTGSDAASLPIFRGGAGIGTYQGPIALTGEVASSFYSDYHFHSFAASARFAAGPVQPFAAYTLTLAYNGLGETTIHSVTAGVQGTF